MPKPSGPNSKCGEKHGPPERSTGKGPRPARHIPWPELFKHHQSVLTGHLKMMDMVRKHCVEGTGNHDTAKACVDRTHQMIRMFKQATYNFVTPRDNIDKVPIGASSASMYPGYSPADHIYGEAAQEFGERAAELKRKGMDLKLDPTGPQYVIGQSKKPRRLSHESGQALSTAASSPEAQVISRQDAKGEPMEGVEQSTSESQYFVIDSKPTPLADLSDMQKHKNKANDKAKRRVSFKEAQRVEANSLNSPDALKVKKVKGATAESPAAASTSAAVQDADISEEVETRLKAKEEKRKRSEEKKRKRESGGSSPHGHAETSAISADGPLGTTPDEKPNKKKHKKDQNELTGAAEPLTKALEHKEAKMQKKEKNKKRKHKADACEQTAASSAPVENEKPKKKMKKDAISN